MNPYEAPESDLENKLVETPKNIFVVYFLIAVSFFVFLVEEIVSAVSEAEHISDFENYIFIPIWAGILFWITSWVRSRKNNPKYTFMILAVVVAGMSVFDPIGPYSIYTGLVEATCFFWVYYMLSRKEFNNWFE